MRSTRRTGFRQMVPDTYFSINPKRIGRTYRPTPARTASENRKRSRGGRGLVHFSADGRIDASKTSAENMDLSPSPRTRRERPRQFASTATPTDRKSNKSGHAADDQGTWAT